MKISLIAVGRRSGQGKHATEDQMVEDYLARASRFLPSEAVWVDSETAFWAKLASLPGRQPAKVILMHAAGRSLTSAEFAETIRDLRDRGTQQAVVGIGGADGWASQSRTRANLVLSMGHMTLPHGLARVVAAEQIYRALTILAGHPYHCGH